MKELLACIPPDKLPFTFIPIGLPTLTDSGESDYRKCILLNNDKQNEIQSIPIMGMSEELLTQDMTTETGTKITVKQYLTQQRSIRDIQETEKSSTCGRFMILALKAHYPEAVTVIEQFWQKIFPNIYLTDEDQENYQIRYKSLPFVPKMAPAGGAVAALGSRISNVLRQEEAKRGTPFSTTPTTWAQKVATQFVFEKDAFPTLPNPPNLQHAPQDESISRQNSTENASINSMTTASQSQGPTEMTTGTTISQDASSVLTELRSILSYQSEQFEKIMKQQAKEAKANRLFMQDMMRMMMNMMQSNQLHQQNIQQTNFHHDHDSQLDSEDDVSDENEQDDEEETIEFHEDSRHTSTKDEDKDDPSENRERYQERVSSDDLSDYQDDQMTRHNNGSRAAFSQETTTPMDIEPEFTEVKRRSRKYQPTQITVTPRLTKLVRKSKEQYPNSHTNYAHLLQPHDSDEEDEEIRKLEHDLGISDNNQAKTATHNGRSSPGKTPQLNTNPQTQLDHNLTQQTENSMRLSTNFNIPSTTNHTTPPAKTGEGQAE